MKKKVIIAMSGGVDSSVAALILKERGYDVVGITLRLIFKEKSDEIKCRGLSPSAPEVSKSVLTDGANESLDKARQVCSTLGIRHYFKNAQGLFEKDVVNQFIGEYLKGRTPNPCIECNRKIKFDYLLSLANQMGADFMATGHYARIIKKNKEFSLERGVDPDKDQSYFLYCLKRDKLKNILFPLGDLTKNEVRKMAASLRLPSAKEKESKDICFIPDGDYAGFISEAMQGAVSPPLAGRAMAYDQSSTTASADRQTGKNGKINGLKGKIVDKKGKVLGFHKGFFNFTIGQRRGLQIAAENRLYVSQIIPSENLVVVGSLKDVYFKTFSIKNINWLCDKKIEQDRSFEVQVRYRHKPEKCRILEAGKNLIKLAFEKPQFALTEGQSAVFYERNRVLGGGIIDTVDRG